MDVCVEPVNINIYMILGNELLFFSCSGCIISSKIVILRALHSAVTIIIANTFSISLAVFQSNRIFSPPW